MQDQDYGWTIEMQLKAFRRGLNVIEIPITALPGKTPSIISGTLKGIIGAAIKILGGIFFYGICDNVNHKNHNYNSQHMANSPVKSPLVFSSGAFSPSGGGNSNAEYSIGKAIYAGRLGSSKCSGCHKRFKRSRLMKLNKSPVDICRPKICIIVLFHKTLSIVT